MTICNPIQEHEVDDWITFLETQLTVLETQSESRLSNGLFQTDDGDVKNAKNILGTMLATLIQEQVTIK